MDALGVKAPIRYAGVKVPSHDRLGSEGQGKEIIYDGVSPVYLIGLGAVWEGVARGALNAAVAHTSSFVHKHRNKNLSDYQAIRQELGAAKVLVETLRPWRNELAARLDELWRAGKPQSEILIPLTEFKVHAAEVAKGCDNSLDRDRRLRLSARADRTLVPRCARRDRDGTVERDRAGLDRKVVGRVAARAVL
ncbi:hypothetical protein [Bradyrhizobium macuxiense]|uniref:hypothetical protein n=1 Tax=Bradyrhizobium macuxiense TaxID=1755647 RepID=UPI000AB13B49|nr:hypothetical protein [Bradyrhizobium macuxiense]